MPAEFRSDLIPTPISLPVSCIDYSEAREILDLTTSKQKRLRRQRQNNLRTHLLLKRTYTLVCDVLCSDCCSEVNSFPRKTVSKYSSSDSISSSSIPIPFSTQHSNIPTVKRKYEDDDTLTKSQQQDQQCIKILRLSQPCSSENNNSEQMDIQTTIVDFLTELKNVKIQQRTMSNMRMNNAVDGISVC
ncbi:unnamed protein product [Didymodactylos carnosus]|uniref:Uncharacterized protein n=1 Tax=Didymodactylos carnosus TaxID=1234261 RepID=A0A814JA65_9BILA|nr:unnamed protein product [Didymodactylos carnosus]CAF1033199.1 unnamed protein product [Didymodactylos carnosus]CAF3631494.1 unnamed protein product [Didymodactylos carnosus]CAF3803950.1 unnamed protein product [Didymodactylos carnosus]